MSVADGLKLFSPMVPLGMRLLSAASLVFVLVITAVYLESVFSGIRVSIYKKQNRKLRIDNYNIRIHYRCVLEYAFHTILNIQHHRYQDLGIVILLAPL